MAVKPVSDFQIGDSVISEPARPSYAARRGKLVPGIAGIAGGIGDTKQTAVAATGVRTSAAELIEEGHRVLSEALGGSGD